MTGHGRGEPKPPPLLGGHAPPRQPLRLPEGSVKMPGRPEAEANGEHEAAPKALPKSPASPISKIVRKNSFNQQMPMVHVHHVCLRDWQGVRLPGLGERSPGAIAVEEEGRNRASSVSALQRGTSSERLGSNPAPKPPGALPPPGPHGPLPPASAMAPEELRKLSQSEAARLNRGAIEWFRTSRAINQHLRTHEDTEMLLASARRRRELGASGGLSARKVSSSSDALCGSAPDTAEPEEVEDPPIVDMAGSASEPLAAVKQEEPARQGPRCRLDPVALWGAKAMLKKKAEPPKVRVPTGKEIPGSIFEGVRVGSEDGGLLKRLQKRAAVIKNSTVE